jgi:hypothetical protein
MIHVSQWITLSAGNRAEHVILTGKKPPSSTKEWDGEIVEPMVTLWLKGRAKKKV